ncbi:trypsin-like serine peptidase [Nonomuraea sp. NPDC050536]|uniref:trypsin-like serine peptidase n=1 Tax=Nonomuraea sp. NPDC050536 TaxID=3364366 RepID=UPI0037C6E511
MKRILLPAGGAILATGLLAAGLAGTAQADNPYDMDQMAAAAKVNDVLNFWTAANGAALKRAEAYTFDYKKVSHIQQKGGYTPDTKPSSVPAIGDEPKKAIKYQNINVPKSIGRVFFAIGDKLYWCSGTSVQSQYRNLVATAGHCVYDIAGNNDVLDKWVFVPGYYQGKAPAGIYVGKTAFTHYDFTNYEDFDRDYAFVQVYNGLKTQEQIQPKKVSYEEFQAWKGLSDAKDIEIGYDEYKKCYDLHGGETPDCWAKASTTDDQVGPDFVGAIKVLKEVPVETYNAAPTGKVNGGKAISATYTEQVTKSAYDAYTGPGYRKIDAKGNYTITHYFVKYWVKRTNSVKFYRTEFYIIDSAAVDAGRLGDNVGGAGLAWNQPTNKYVRTFGYPGGEHPDGNRPYTGVTPKWCYNKTSGKATVIAAYKVEEQVALKCAVTGGMDGSSWLYKYSNAKRTGYVNGITSLILDVDGNNRYDTITSPYFDGETAVVYKAASNQWSGKLY